MTIPNVTMCWCKQQITCKWCNKPIEQGTPKVVVFYWNKGNPDSRRWNNKVHYHPQCWIDQGLDYLSRNPYVPHKRGRVRTLSTEDARKRFLLVRKFNSLVQRKNSIRSDYPDRILAEVKLNNEMIKVAEEMVNLGGVPKTWAEKLTT